MTVIAILPAIAAVIGLLTYVLASNAKVAEIGRIVFMTAILVVWFTMASKVVKF